LRDVYDGNLKKDFYFENKYLATEDLRPEVYKYDDSVIGALIESGIHQKMIDLFGYELFLCHVQMRIAYNENDFSYMPWHRDTYLYEDEKVIGPIPPMKKVIYYPKFDDLENNCLMFALGSHLNAKHIKEEDLSQLNNCSIMKIKNSVDEYLILNTEALHHAVPPENERQMRVVYSFCPIGQLDHHGNLDLHNEYTKRLNENLHSE